MRAGSADKTLKLHWISWKNNEEYGGGELQKQTLPVLTRNSDSQNWKATKSNLSLLFTTSSSGGWTASAWVPPGTGNILLF